MTNLQTTISISNRRTVILGGLAVKSRSGEAELIILLTPRIREDADR